MSQWNPAANSLFAQAIEIEAPDQRQAYLNQACGGDEQLRGDVERLLAAHNDAGSFLVLPAQAFTPTIASGDWDTADEESGEISLDFLSPSEKSGCLGRLGPYEVVEVVGRGGMGLVLRAYDPKLNRVVAIKVMAPSLAANPMAVKRFLREARAAAAVSHDHVITIHDIDEGFRPPFIVMEYVDGMSLQEKIDRTGGLELKEILRIGMQIARGLSAAHEQGLVHRDVKPANILLENGVERVKLTDFGLARAADDVSVTRTGQIAGTPQFMSPEQAQGQAIDARSDLFSLGSVLYAMCAGRPPFRAETPLAMLRRVCDDAPRPLRDVNAEIPDWLEAIILKLLEKNPDERLQTADEVADLLSRHLAHLQHPTTAPKPRAVARPAKPGAVHVDEELAFVETSLRVYGWVALMWAIMAILFATAVFVFPGDYTAGFFHLNAPWALVTGVLSLATSALSFMGLWHVVRRESHRRAMIGNAAALLPVNPMLLFAVPWTIASLVKLRQPQVRRAFAPQNQHSSAGVVIEAALAIGGCLALMLIAAAVIYVQTDKGTLVIESVDENVEIMVAQPRSDTHEGMTVRVVDRLTGSEVVRLPSGHYRLILMSGPDANPNIDLSAFQLSKEQFVLKRGGKVVVKLTHRLGVAPDSRKRLTELVRLEGHQKYVHNLDFAPNGWQLVTGSGNPENDVVLWDARNGRRLRQYTGHRRSVHEVKFSPDGKYVASAGKSGEIILCDADSLAEVRRFTGHRGFVDELAFSPDGKLLASGSDNWNVKGGDVSVRVWEVETGRELWRHEFSHDENQAPARPGGQVWAVAFSPDGEQLLTAHQAPAKRLSIFAAKTGALIRQFGGGEPRESNVRCAAWSPTGDRVATGHAAVAMRNNQWHDAEKCVIRLYDANSGKELRLLTGHSGPIDTLDFSPDGKLLASGSGGQYLNDKTYENASSDNSVRIWEVASGRELLRRDMNQAVKCVRFSPDGNKLATSTGAVGEMPDLRIWQLPAGEAWKAPSADSAADFPFVILAGPTTEERAFDTLASAVAAATNGDAIEIRGEGPFVSAPIVIRERALTIRAAQGFTPTIELSPHIKDATPLIDSYAALVVEGLKLGRTPVVEIDDEDRGYPVIRSTAAPLFVTNCEFANRFLSINSLNSPICEIRNCMFVQSTSAVAYRPPAGGRLRMHNNVHTGTGLLHLHYGDAAGLDDISVELTHNTVIARLLWLFLHNRPSPQEESAPPIRIRCDDNVVSAVDHMIHFSRGGDLLLSRQPLSAQEMKLALKQTVAWEEGRNLYDLKKGYVATGLNSLPLEGPPFSIESYDDWAQFWQTDKNVALLGQPSFATRDVYRPAAANLTSLTPNDFRLQRSPGTRAASDARDLGIAANEVGAGDGYERWKAAPESRRVRAAIASIMPDPESQSGSIVEVRRFEGHTDFVDGVAYSADGRFIASGAADGTVRVWDANTGAEVSKTEGLGPVGAVAVSPDGSIVAAGANGKNQISLVERATGRIVRAFGPQDRKTHSLAFSSDGSQLLSGDYSGSAVLWSVASGEVIRELIKDGPPVERVGFSRNGRLAFAADDDGTIRLWNAREWNLSRTITGASREAALSSDGRLLVTSGGALYETESGDRIKTYDIPDVASEVHFTPDDRHIVVCQWSNRLRVIDATTGNEVAYAKSPTHGINEAAISPDGRFVVTGGGWFWKDKIVRTGDNLARVWRLPESVWPPGSGSGSASVKEVNTAERLFTGPQSGGMSVALSHDGSLVLVGHGEGDVSLWSAATGEWLRDFAGAEKAIYRTLFWPDGKHVAAASGNGIVHLWNLETAEEVRRFEGHTGRVESMALSPDGSLLLTGAADYAQRQDRSVRLWNAATGEQVRSFAAELLFVRDLAFSHDGGFAYGGGAGTTSIIQWDVASSAAVHRFAEQPTTPLSLAVSPNGDLLAAGYMAQHRSNGQWDDPENCVVRLWDLKSRKVVRELRGHTGPVGDLAFTPSGRFLLTAAVSEHDHTGTYVESGDQTLRLWDVASGRELARYHTQERVSQLAAAPDEESFITVGDSIRLWRLPQNAVGLEAGPSLPSKFCLIPAGEFAMGTLPEHVDAIPPDDSWFFADFVPDRREAETPQHRVTITKAFEMSAYEVTVGQFKQFVEATGYQTTAEQERYGYGWRNGEWVEGADFNWRNPGFEQSDDHPICNVSWDDANEFCRWLSDRDGATYRLPTEAEWEYACRAGTTTLFSTGDNLDSLQGAANLADAKLHSEHPTITWAVGWNDGFAATAPVGSLAPNAWGLYDMHGNAWEWCQDEYDRGWYEISPIDDPICRGSSDTHVFRGGGFDNWPGFLRSADRYSSHSEELRTQWAGFRVVRESN